MRYGWYLLDRRQRELLLSDLGEETLAHGPFHVDFQLALPGTKGDEGVWPQRPGDSMNLDRFRRLVDELAALGLVSARLSGGEPFAHPRFAELVTHLERAGVTISEIQTRAAGLDDAAIHAILGAGVHTVHLDVDEVDRFRDALASGTRESKLPDGLDASRRLAEARLRHGSLLPKVIARFLVTRQNAAHVQGMLDFAREHGFAGAILDLATQSERPPGSEPLSPAAAFRLRQTLARASAAAPPGFLGGTAVEDPSPPKGGSDGLAARLAGASRLLFSVGRAAKESAAAWRGDAHNYLPWYHARVDATFRVRSCCHLAGDSAPALGSVWSDTFSSVWNGPGFRGYRRELALAMRGGAAGGEHVRADCLACPLRADLADAAFAARARAQLEPRHQGASAPEAEGPRPVGFDALAFRALRERFPLAGFGRGELETVSRMHAEAELARQEALRSVVLASDLERAANAMLGDTGDPAEAERRRIEARELRVESAALERRSEILFREARAAGGHELCAAAPPLPSLLSWLARLAQGDSRIETTVDEKRLIWMSFFKTLSEHVDVSEIRQALGVGVGFDGPERHYNDLFDENVAVDLVDYSHLNPETKFVVADIERGIDYPDGSFDLVYSHSVFEHLKNPERAIAEIDRLLRPGKYVYITVSPLYFSPRGSHVNVPVSLARWEHLDPASKYYLIECPHPEHVDAGYYLNKLTIAQFLAAVGRVGWELRHFGVRIVDPDSVPPALVARFPLVDLVAEEFRFIGRKVVPRPAFLATAGC